MTGVTDGSIWVRGVLLCVALAPCLLPAEGQQTQAEDQPEIESVSPEIRVWRGGTGKAESIVRPSRVAPQDRIGSLGGAVAVLSVRPDVLVTLKGVEARAEEGLAVERAGGKIVLKLYRGSAVIESREAEVTLDTPSVKVHGKAVYILVEVRKDSVRVVAVDGTLTLTNEAGSVELAGGEFSTAQAGKPPTKGRPADLGKDLAWVSAAESSANLLKNPAFEDGLTDWQVLLYKNKPLVRIDEKVSRGGRRSARIDIPGIRLEGSNPDLKWGNVPLEQVRKGVLKPGARYFLQLWVRTEGYRVDGANAKVNVHVEFSGDSKDGLDLPCPDCEGTWRCAKTFFTAQGTDLTLALANSDKSVVNGTIWIDEVFIGLVADNSNKPK